MIESRPLVIYHANCADGFGSAWVARKYFNNSVDFHSGVYGEPPPDVTDRGVYIVDFSYKRPILLEMAKTAQFIIVIDHHKTAEEDLVDLPENVAAEFDMNHSGVILTWQYFFGEQEPPALLKHIEDRDLWKFQLPYTREIQASVFSYPYDFDIWDILMTAPVENLAKEGMAIERKHFKDIHEMLKVVTRKMVIGGYTVPVANLPYIYSSDAGHIMAKGEAFAACYWDTPKGRVFSLRSTEGGQDVSNIAKQYGGGGHRSAAGFTVDYKTAAGFEL